MLRKIFNNKLKFFLILVILFTASFSSVFASTLFFSPEGGTYNAGETISVRVKVSSPNVSINAISGRVVYSKDTLSLISISKSGSLINLWAQEPSFSNTTGNASFEGVTLSGYTGDNATVVTLNFRALKEGTGTVQFVSASVLANDGEGTNTLTTTNQATFTIKKKEIVKTEPKPAATEPKTTEPTNLNNEETAPSSEVETKQSVSPRVEYMVLGISPIVFYLCILWIILVFLILYFALRYKYKIKKRLNEVKDLTRKDFDLLKEDQKETSQILSRDMENVEKEILKEIDEIEEI